MKVYGRKFLVYVLALAALIAARFFMPLKFYEVFAQYVFLLSLGFTGGNAIEYLAGALKK